MSNLPYALIEDNLIDKPLVEHWWKEFSEKYSHTSYHRNNGGTSEFNITELYAHELFIKDDPNAVAVKENEINVYVEKILKKLNLENVEYHTVFLVTHKGLLDWHNDEASSTRPGCSAALMYSLNEDKRAPTEWMYNDTYYKLDGYKFSLINCSCTHRVDNRNHDKRITFRTAMYGLTFEEIRDRVLQSGYTI